MMLKLNQSEHAVVIGIQTVLASDHLERHAQMETTSRCDARSLKWGLRPRFPVATEGAMKAGGNHSHRSIPIPVGMMYVRQHEVDIESLDLSTTKSRHVAVDIFWFSLTAYYLLRLARSRGRIAAREAYGDCPRPAFLVMACERWRGAAQECRNPSVHNHRTCDGPVLYCASAQRKG